MRSREPLGPRSSGAGGDEPPRSQQVDPEGLSTALAPIMAIPRAWVGTMIGLALISCFEVSRASGGGIGVDFVISTVTVGVVALIWLPVLLRVFALGGGRLSALGVEASSAGLREIVVQTVAGVKTTVEAAERGEADTADVVSEVEQQVDQLAIEYLGGTNAIDRHTVMVLARGYERLRATMPRGGERTTRMTRIVNEARVRAAANPGQAGSADAQGFLQRTATR